MAKLNKRSVWIGVVFTAVLALGACTGEIPPELLEAAAVARSSGIESLEIDLSTFAEELEFIGEVQSIAAGEWLIANLNFIVEASTEIKGDPVIGDLVKVHATLTPGGGLLAREIEPADGNDAFEEDNDAGSPFDLENEFEFTGSVEAIGTVEWMIAGRTVVILPRTEIKGSIILGDVVKVHAFLNEAGDLAAREIELSIAGSDDGKFAFDLANEFEFVGLVELIGSTAWTIGGRSVLILPETEIKGTMAEGDLAKVHAFLNPSGELAAREIEPTFPQDLDQDELDDDHDVKLVGVVEEIGADSWIVGGVEFRVTADTEIEDEVSVGDLVEVYFFTGGDDGPVAREIELEDESSDDDMDDSDDDDDDDDSDSDFDDDDDDDDHDDDSSKDDDDDD